MKERSDLKQMFESCLRKTYDLIADQIEKAKANKEVSMKVSTSTLLSCSCTNLSSTCSLSEASQSPLTCTARSSSSVQA
jgi:hypothetical protein